MLFFLLIITFLCWGSFLNVVAYRLMAEKSLLFPRSYCPHCNYIIAWYDNFPIISWLVLRGKCRSCKHTISWLYPCIELITALSCSLIFYCTDPSYWFSYIFLFSALIISMRTDLETLLLSRFLTLGLIPFGLLFSYLQLLPITLYESLIGCISAYAFLYAIASIYYVCTKKVGLGQGDIELLAGIGSFLGFIGWWITLLLASLTGTIIGIILMLCYGASLRMIKIPFGPFLALGAISYVLFQQFFFSLIFF